MLKLCEGRAKEPELEPESEWKQEKMWWFQWLRGKQGEKEPSVQFFLSRHPFRFSTFLLWNNFMHFNVEVQLHIESVSGCCCCCCCISTVLHNDCYSLSLFDVLILLPFLVVIAVTFFTLPLFRCTYICDGGCCCCRYCFSVFVL